MLKASFKEHRSSSEQEDHSSQMRHGWGWPPPSRLPEEPSLTVSFTPERNGLLSACLSHKHARYKQEAQSFPFSRPEVEDLFEHMLLRIH